MSVRFTGEVFVWVKWGKKNTGERLTPCIINIVNKCEFYRESFCLRE